MQNKPNYILPKHLQPKQIIPQTNEEIHSKSYNKENILGCKHYSRNCKIRAFCCQRFYVCRLCHNESGLDHEINRHETKEVLCMECDTIQPVSNECINCKKQFGHYYCSVCVFFDNDTNKKLFHCSGCGICRVGKREDYIHCNGCKQCLPPSTYKSHKCIKDANLSNCPICFEDLFNSREGTINLECGHIIHNPCYKDLIRSKSFQCPLCKKSLGKIDWDLHDKFVKKNKMPEMYEGSTVGILCNDCGEKSNDLPLHFLGQRCPNCGSYNTTETSRNLIIDKTKSSDFVVVQDDNENGDGDDDSDIADDDDDDDDDDGELDDELDGELDGDEEIEDSGDSNEELQEVGDNLDGDE